MYDFIDHNTEDVAVAEQGDTHIGSFVSFFKVKKQILITCSPWSHKKWTIQFKNDNFLLYKGKEKGPEKSQKNEELGDEKR